MKERGIGIFISMFILLMFLSAGSLMVDGYLKEVKSLTETAEGVIIDFNSIGAGGKKKYAPIVEYYVNGKRAVGSSSTWVGGLLRKLQIGDEVIVLYNSEDVSDIRIKEYDSSSQLYFGILIIILGFIIPYGIIKGTWNS